MKNTTIKIFIFSFLLCSFATTVMASHTMALVEVVPNTNRPATFITLRAGTPVSLSLNEAISSEEVEVGNSLDFTVRSNVTINGQVVIAAGSIALGWVQRVNKSCDDCKQCKNDCAKITITVESVQAVDGQMIYLRSIPHTVRGRCCGKGAARVNTSTNLMARILNDARVNA